MHPSQRVFNQIFDISIERELNSLSWSRPCAFPFIYSLTTSVIHLICLRFIFLTRIAILTCRQLILRSGNVSFTHTQRPTSYHAVKCGLRFTTSKVKLSKDFFSCQKACHAVYNAVLSDALYHCLRRLKCLSGKWWMSFTSCYDEPKPLICTKCTDQGFFNKEVIKIVCRSPFTKERSKWEQNEPPLLTAIWQTLSGRTHFC